MKKILIIYHSNCPDGFGAAWAAWKKFGNRAEYISVSPEELPGVFPKNREIYAVDVSYPISVQRKLRAENKKLVIIDHHISLKNDTVHFPENVFDNDHSGAVLAWKYFHPGKPVSRLLRYVEDVDLWRFALPKNRDVTPYIFMKERSFEEWDRMAREFGSRRGFLEYVKRGTLLREYEDSAMKNIIERSVLVLFEGRKMRAVNNSFKPYTSELGYRLIRKKPPMAIIWYEDKKGLNVSLRSNGKVDVSKIAAKHGGGGHKQSSGFIVKSRKKPWKWVKI